MARPRYDRNVLLSSFITSQLVGELLAQELEGTGLRPDRFGVQSVIVARGPLTPSELAAFLGLSPSTVSSWLQRLERAGATLRRPNPSDGRSVLIEATPLGKSEVEAALPSFRRALSRVNVALGGELGVVEGGYQRLEQALRDALGHSD